MSRSKKLSIEKKGLKHRLFIIEALIFILPFLALAYIFYKNQLSFTVSEWLIFALVLVLILAASIILRQIIENMLTIAASMKKAVTGNNYLKAIEKAPDELNDIKSSFNALMHKFEETTQELQRRFYELVALKELNDLSIKLMDIEELLKTLLEKSMTVTRSKVGAILMVQPNQKRFRVLAYKGHHSQLPKHITINIDDSLSRHVVYERKPLLISDVSTDPRARDLKYPQFESQSLLSMPIFIRNRLLAVLNLSHKNSDRPFDSMDIEILSIMVGEIGQAVENAYLHSKVRKQLLRLQDHMAKLTMTNEQLQDEIVERKRAEARLKRTRNELEKRAGELATINNKLQNESEQRQRTVKVLRNTRDLLNSKITQLANSNQQLKKENVARLRIESELQQARDELALQTVQLVDTGSQLSLENQERRLTEEALQKSKEKLEMKIAEMADTNQELQNEIAKHKQAQKALQKSLDELESQIEQRIQDLTKSNKKLQQEKKTLQEAASGRKMDELKFRSLFDLSPQAVALMDPETTRIIDANDNFCKIFDYDRDKFLQNKPANVGFFTESDRQRFMAELKASTDIQKFEMDFKTKDGSILNTIMFSRRIEFDNKNYILAIFQNHSADAP